MRTMIIALVAILVLGGGAAGAYFYFSQQAAASAGPEGQAQELAAKEKEHKAEKSHSEFVELDPLILPIVDNNGVSQTVSMIIAIEVSSSETAANVKHLSPKLKDAYIQDMYGALSRHAALKGGILQVNVLKERLNKVTDEVMGIDVVDDVLLQVVQQRPI